MEYNPNARKLLKKHGNEVIKEMFLIKTFNNVLLKGFCRVLFSKKYKHVKPFHIEFKIITENGTTLFLEKSFQIKINYRKRVAIAKETTLQFLDSNTNTNTKKVHTLNTLLQNAKKYMGKRFGSYRVMNNCQNFVDALMKSNNIINTEREEVKQELEHYLTGSFCAVHFIDFCMWLFCCGLRFYFTVLYGWMPFVYIPYCLFLDARLLLSC
jgi:hypothetical protein